MRSSSTWCWRRARLARRGSLADRIEWAISTVDIPPWETAPEEIESASDLEFVRTAQFNEPREDRGGAWAAKEWIGKSNDGTPVKDVDSGAFVFGPDVVTSQVVSVQSIGQEAIAAKLELHLKNVLPEEQALLKRWKGISDSADGEAIEDLTIRCLAAEHGLSPEGMRKRLNKVLRKALG